jgi:DNA polymerase III delta prime subunit
MSLGKLHPMNCYTEATSLCYINIAYNSNQQVYRQGLFYLKYNDFTLIIRLGEDNRRPYSLVVFCPDIEGVKWFKEKFNYYRITENIYRGKTIKVDKRLSFIKPKASDFNNLVLDQKIKESVYDQTIFFLKNMKGMNGIILHGDPGTGKTYTSACLAYEALKEGITVISLYNINSTSILQIKDFVYEYCKVVLICIEDMDSASKSREMHNSSDSLAPLLEFMDGFGSNSDISCAVLGTTNHLDKLDKAIGERPCRFNRKIFFDYLAIEQIEFILKNLFQQDIKEEFLDIFRNKEKITPSHLAEIYRTAKMMQIKNKSVDPIDFFLKATEEVLNSFTPTINTKPVGFRDIGED